MAATDDVDAPDDDDAGGGRGGPSYPWNFGDGDRRGPLIIIGAIVLALLTIMLIVWYLNRDENGENPPITPGSTVESVIDTVPSGSPEATNTPLFIPTSTVEADDPAETEEPTPRRGGDNQRDASQPEDALAVGGSTLSMDVELGPVARQCSDRCLVRVRNTSDLNGMMSAAVTRPSFATGEWTWLIASARGIAYFEQGTETVLVSDSPDTLALYAAVVPAQESSENRSSQIGTVIDSAGNVRIVQSERVPANVRPLTDWGYEVHKLAPAPPLEVLTPDEPLPLASIEIGSLMDDVSGNNIERAIQDLLAMGSGSPDGAGTRYYTTRGNSEAAEYLFQQLESYGLTVWYEDFLSWEGYLMVNVIAEIPGQDATAIYGVMAHFDSIATDIMAAPGADDNATGVAASLEIARTLSSYQLHHPLHIIFVNVEEVGIVGSQQFAKNAQEEGKPYEGVYNLDSIGAQRQHGWMVVNGNASTTWMASLLVDINATYGLRQVISARTSDSIVADDNRLREHGIDSLMVSRELYGQSPTHHTGGDTMEVVSVQGVVRAAQLTLLALASLVQS